MGLHFDIRDVFRCVRLGWSGKKIWVGLVGLVVAYLGYTALVLIAHMTAGTSLSTLWHRFGLFPGARMGEFALLGSFLHVLGMLWAVAVVMITTSMQCKIAFQQLRGDDFFSSGDAWQFVKGHWKAVLFGPVAVLALFAFFVVTGIVIGLVARWIPVVGELVFALSFIPIFFAALVAVFISIVFCVSLMMSPAIVGSVGEDALEVVIQSFSLTWSQPWRLVLYGAWMKLSVWIGFMVLGTLSLSAIGLISWACGLFMDVKLANLLAVATAYMPLVPEQWDALVFANLPAPGTVSGAELWAGRLLGLMLILVTGIVLAYVQAAYASGTSLIYVILRHRKDDENLLEWDADDFDMGASEDAKDTPSEANTDVTDKETNGDSADAETT